MNNLIWGVVGHPTWLDYADWVSGNMAKQIAWVNKLGCSYYRCSFESAEYPAILDQIVPSAVAGHMNILPILPVSQNTGLSPYNNYVANFNMATGWAGHAIAKGYHIPYWELGNEMENNGQFTINGDGSSILHFRQNNPKAFVLLATSVLGAYSGMRHAYHQANLTPSKALFGFCYHHYGLYDLFKYMEPYLGGQLPFDVISWHWYPPDYGTFAIAASGLTGLGKDIWITEINRAQNGHNGSMTTSGINEALQAQTLASGIADVRKSSNVKAIFVYELLDEPKAAGTNPVSAYMGLVNNLSGVPRQAFATYQHIVTGA